MSVLSCLLLAAVALALALVGLAVLVRAVRRALVA